MRLYCTVNYTVLSPKVLHWIYTSIVRHKLSYAALIWWPKCQQVTAQKQLSKLQRLALTSITGAMTTAPTAALEVMLNIEPLHIHIEAKARSTMLRLHHFNLLKKVNYGHSKLWSKMIKDSPELVMPCDAIKPTYRFEKSFRVKIPSREDWQNNHPASVDSPISWYSDGSVSELAGTGLYCAQANVEVSIPLGIFATVFQTEVMGIIGCCQELSNPEENGRTIHVFTDSQATLKALKKWKFTSALMLNCHDALQSLASQNEITLTWVPGHCGIPGNERADELARVASSSPLNGPEPGLPLTLSSLQKIIKAWKDKYFVNHWHSLNSARQAKNCLSINVKHTKYFLTLSKRNIKRLTDILTGHCSLNNHLYRLNLADSPHCDKCGEIETAEHLLCHCPAYIQSRAKCLGSYTLSYSSIRSVHPRHILNFLNHVNNSTN